MSAVDVVDDDPFACFGDDDDGDESLSNPLTTNASSSDAIPKNENVQAIKANNNTRDSSCGILAFHHGTEQSLLRHVQLELANKHSQDNKDRDCAVAVLGLIDDFCLTRHWMMHVGSEKGLIIRNFLEKCCHANAKTSSRTLVTMVELGTYCGYSSILLAKTVKDLGYPCHLFTIEVVEKNAKVAQELIRLSQLEEQISVLLLDPHETSLPELLKKAIKTKSPDYCSAGDMMVIDFLFIDHDKSQYLCNLQQLERSGLIRQGTFVAADNVVFAKIDDYRHYVTELSHQGIVETRLEESRLEYCEPDCANDETRKQLRDGVGKYQGVDVVLLMLFCFVLAHHNTHYLCTFS
jgi:catechol O-methyltransferase